MQKQHLSGNETGLARGEAGLQYEWHWGPRSSPTEAGDWVFVPHGSWTLSSACCPRDRVTLNKELPPQEESKSQGGTLYSSTENENFSSEGDLGSPGEQPPQCTVW